MVCTICKGEGWICENHPDKAWGEGSGCCGGAGMPCECNTSNPPWVHMEEVHATNEAMPLSQAADRPETVH